MYLVVVVVAAVDRFFIWRSSPFSRRVTALACDST